MVARNFKQLDEALIVTRIVDASQVVTKGYGVILSTDADHVKDGGANGKVIGVALESGIAGDAVQICLLSGGAIVPAKTGTAGVTAGEYVIMDTLGFVNQTLGGGTTVKYVAGKALTTATVGEYFDLEVGQFASGAA